MYVTAMPGIATLGIAENHIKMNSIGFQYPDPPTPHPPPPIGPKSGSWGSGSEAKCPPRIHLA